MIDLQFSHVSKRYRITEEQEANGGNPFINKLKVWRSNCKDFWALRDVDFEVERGEAVGIIGHNGAGKSTILKLLSNITTPTSGQIKINGRLSALIEVGSGFHPELTGRENVYLSGSILGMGRREITEKLESIVEFAELKQFIDVPVKRYSSGMYVRLGFSIAAHLNPDILLLDEVLAVGDAAFQEKCLERISELKRTKKTIVFVSHDLGAVERLCDRVILLRQGEIHSIGTARQIISEYQQLSTAPVAHRNSKGPAILSKTAEITYALFQNAEGVKTISGATGYPLVIRLGYTAHEAISDVAFEIFFYSQDNELRCHVTTELDDRRIDLMEGEGVIEFMCPSLSLNPGVYSVGATIITRGAPTGSAIDWKDRFIVLRVDPGKTTRGAFFMNSTWKLSGTKELENTECEMRERTVLQ